MLAAILIGLVAFLVLNLFIEAGLAAIFAVIVGVAVYLSESRGL